MRLVNVQLYGIHPKKPLFSGFLLNIVKKDFVF